MSHSKTQDLDQNFLTTPTLNKFYPYIDRKERSSKKRKAVCSQRCTENSGSAY